MGGIARNFAREGMNPLFPRVDWRGDGPGFVEMEFPFLSWTMAVFYRAFGSGEIAGRVLTFLISLATLAIFVRLAGDSLGRLGVLAATAFYLSSPLVSELSTKLQPEMWMMLGYVAAIRHFLMWTEHGRVRDYLIALAATSFAILAKATAAHVGLLFLLIVLARWGVRALRDLRLWGFALASLLPATIWYVHAHRLWLNYGNSLGLSDEAHWFSFDLLGRPLYFLGILRQEVFHVWMPAGVLLIVLVLAYFRPFKRMQLLVLWGTSLVAYYVLTVRSAAHDPLYYYHVVSVPVAAIAFGLAVELIAALKPDRERPSRMAVVSGFAALVMGLMGVLGLSRRVLVAGTGLLTIAVGLVSALVFGLNSKVDQSVALKARFRSIVSALSVTLASMTLLTGVGLSVYRQLTCLRPHALMACAREFAVATVPGDLILVSGGTCLHPAGGRAAYNTSYFLYWMNRKGFTICLQRQTVEQVETFRLQGARFFVAEKQKLAGQAGFEQELRKRYTVVAECPEATMFSLRETGHLPTSPDRGRL